MYQQAKNICKYVIPELNNYFKKFEIFSIEEEILEDIDDFENLKFKGYVDLILKTPDDRYHIIDWKTCSWGWNARKKADPLVDYQLTYYKNFISKKHNLNLSKIDTYFALLKRTAKTNHVEIFKVTSGSKKVENSLKILKNAAINIEKGFFIKNRLSCSKCEFYKTKYCK
jgi:hypothetical protein